MINALIIDERDTVAVAIEPIAENTDACIRLKDGSVKTLKVIENIPIYHKFAVEDMAKDAPVVKYGEHIGVAACLILAGKHVHEHNVESRREDLERR